MRSLLRVCVWARVCQLAHSWFSLRVCQFAHSSFSFSFSLSPGPLPERQEIGAQLSG